MKTNSRRKEYVSERQGTLWNIKELSVKSQQRGVQWTGLPYGPKAYSKNIYLKTQLALLLSVDLWNSNGEERKVVPPEIKPKAILCALIYDLRWVIALMRCMQLLCFVLACGSIMIEITAGVQTIGPCYDWYWGTPLASQSKDKCHLTMNYLRPNPGSSSVVGDLRYKARWLRARNWNSATPFIEAKRIQGVKLGKWRGWAPATYITATDDYSCYHSRGSPPKAKWPNSYEFGWRSWEFGHWLYLSGNAFVGTFKCMTVYPHPSPGRGQSILWQRGSTGQKWVGWRDENLATLKMVILCSISRI